MIYPDAPRQISADFLARLDADPPGTWVGGPKKDGKQRCLHYDNGRCVITAKQHKERDEMQRHISPPKCDDGVSISGEWVGPRKDSNGNMPRHFFYVFEILRFRGEWLRDMSRSARYHTLRLVLRKAAMREDGAAQWGLLLEVPNPGLVDLLGHQLTDPESEGVVIRRADSGLILSEQRNEVNPLCLKCKIGGGS